MYESSEIESYSAPDAAMWSAVPLSPLPCPEYLCYTPYLVCAGRLDFPSRACYNQEFDSSSSYVGDMRGKQENR